MTPAQMILTVTLPLQTPRVWEATAAVQMATGRRTIALVLNVSNGGKQGVR